MVQIVEFADAGEAAFEHLDIGERCDGADVVGGHPIEKAVHGLAPRPEAITRRSAPLGESGHAALEGVAVEVGKTGQRATVARVAGGGRGAGLDRKSTRLNSSP